jgi:hypothetical protein
MSYFDGVDFGRDQIGSSYEVAPFRMPKQQAMVQYVPVIPQNWQATDIDNLALQQKLIEDAMRPAYKRREFMHGSPNNNDQCSCACKHDHNKDMSITNVNIICYVFIFIVVIFLAMHHIMDNQLENIKELFRLATSKHDK